MQSIRRRTIVQIAFSLYDQVRLSDSAWLGRRLHVDYPAGSHGSTCRTGWCPLALVSETPYTVADSASVSGLSSRHERCHKNNTPAASVILASPSLVPRLFHSQRFAKTPCRPQGCCVPREWFSLPVSSLPRHDHPGDRVAHRRSTPIRRRAHRHGWVKTSLIPGRYVMAQHGFRVVSYWVSWLFPPHSKSGRRSNAFSKPCNSSVRTV